MVTTGNPETGGSLPPNVTDIVTAARKRPPRTNLEASGPTAPILYFEEEVSRRIEPSVFLHGLMIIVNRKELDLYEDPDNNKRRLDAAARVKKLIIQANLGLTSGIFTLDEDGKGKIQKNLIEIGFSPTEVSTLGVKRATKEALNDYVPLWAVEQVRRTMDDIEEYAQSIRESAWERVSAGDGESLDEAFQNCEADIIIEEARRRVEARRQSYSKPEVAKLTPISQNEFLAGLREIASKFRRE